MQQLMTGTYMGKNSLHIPLDNLVLTVNEYTSHCASDWHCHQNLIFALVLKGGNVEFREKEKIESLPGTLLFYPSHLPHRNQLYKSGSKIFHVEIQRSWMAKYNLEESSLNCASVITDPAIKALFVKLKSEAATTQNSSQLVIEGLLLQLFGELKREKYAHKMLPGWLATVKDLLHDDQYSSLSYAEIAALAGVHPATLSKVFPTYFHCTVGEYARKVKIDKSLPLLSKKALSVEEVAFQCGFYDASHFVRTFKELVGYTPTEYRKKL